VALTTVATVVVVLDHVPPVVPSVNVIVEPAQNDEDAEILAGNAFTVTMLVTPQPVLSVNDITDVPADTPVTNPAPVPTVATVVVPLDHVPPVVPSVSVVVEPAHKGDDADMATGVVLTVTMVVALQPVPSE